MINRISVPATFILAAIFVLAPLVLASLVSKNKLDQSMTVTHHEQLHKPLSINFTPQHQYLNIVVLELKNPGLLDKNLYKVSLKSGSNILRELEFSGQNIGDPSQLRFQFAPLAEASLETLTLVVEPLSPNLSTSGITVAVNNSGPAFTAFYRNSGFPRTAATALVDVIKKISSDAGFLTIWLGAMLSLFGLNALWSKKP